MALFKVFKGIKSSLPSLSSSQDGYCYFTTDDGMFYIDYKNANGILERKALNSNDAKTLLGASLETILTENDKKVPTSKAVLTKIGEVEQSVAAINSALNGKQATITGAATTITGSNLTASRALVSNSSGKVAVSDVTSIELGYLDGVTSAIQTQLNAKSSSTHKHSVSHTPAGTVSKPTFTGTEATISAEYTPAGIVSKPTFTGSEVTSGAPAGTTTVYSITDVGTLPSCTYTAPSANYTAPSLSATVENHCLKLTFAPGSHTFNPGSHTFSAGKLPTKGSGVSVATGTHTHKVTASGTVSQPTFTGTKATISTEYTPTGSVSQPTFTGTAATLTSGTPQ